MYVSQRPSKDDKFAVLVYFHGGGFYKGSGIYEERTPDSLIKQGIIIVTVNYRLGPMGKSIGMKYFLTVKKLIGIFVPNRIPQHAY